MTNWWRCSKNVLGDGGGSSRNTNTSEARKGKDGLRQTDYENSRWAFSRSWRSRVSEAHYAMSFSISARFTVRAIPVSRGWRGCSWPGSKRAKWARLQKRSASRGDRARASVAAGGLRDDGRDRDPRDGASPLA